jgi:sugar phosphate isomerase/epimerase
MGTGPDFAVSQFTTWHQSFEQDVALYVSLGVEAMEVCERKLSPDRAIAGKQLAFLKETGLRVTSVQPRIHALFPDGMCPDIADPVKRSERFRHSVDLFAECFPGESLPLVAISGKAPDFDYRGALRTARKLYPQLADYAGDRGVRIAFEPLSPILMNADTFVCSLKDAVDLVQEVDRPNFGLLLDLWHVWSEPGIVERIAGLGEMVFGVHISDWPAGGPRHVADRVLPGDGVIDLPSLLGALERSGYRGAYCLEIFSKDDLPGSLWMAEPGDVIERAREGFARAWGARR